MRTECDPSETTYAWRRCGAVAMALALACASCEKPVADSPPAPEPASTAPAPVPASPSPAAPAPRSVQATPAPENHLAPPGVFFLVGKVSIETDSGITGLRPGTVVRQQSPTEYTTQDGQKLTLRPDQVTNDVRIARQVAGADSAMQAALARASAPRPPTRPNSFAATPTPTPLPTASAPPPPPGPRATSMGASGALGASHSRVKDGWVWEKTRDGIWYKSRPVR